MQHQQGETFQGTAWHVPRVHWGKGRRRCGSDMPAGQTSTQQPWSQTTVAAEERNGARPRRRQTLQSLAQGDCSGKLPADSTLPQPAQQEPQAQSRHTRTPADGAAKGRQHHTHTCTHHSLPQASLPCKLAAAALRRLHASNGYQRLQDKLQPLSYWGRPSAGS
jgi:hypothetical protein